jgi:nicotinamide-nucleotide amidase
VGTAPGFILEVGDKAIICLPGVPHEMRYLLQERVLPYLRQEMGETAVIISRWVHTVAIGESAVDQAITDLMHGGNPTVGTRAHPGQTDVCITAKATTRGQALRLLDAMESQVRQRLGSAVYGVDDETLPGVVVAALCRMGMTLAVAETTTDGLIAHGLREAAGGEQVLVAAHAAPDGTVLAQELSIAASTDEDMASAIAAALRETHDVDLGLAIVAGTAENDRLYVALAAPGGLRLRDWPSRSRSDYATAWTLHLALDMVRRWLMS